MKTSKTSVFAIRTTSFTALIGNTTSCPMIGVPRVSVQGTPAEGERSFLIVPTGGRKVVKLRLDWEIGEQERVEIDDVPGIDPRSPCQVEAVCPGDKYRAASYACVTGMALSTVSPYDESLYHVWDFLVSDVDREGRLVGMCDGKPAIYTKPLDQVLELDPGPLKGLVRMAISLDGKRIYGTTKDCAVMWNGKAGKIENSFNGYRPVAHSPNLEWIVLSNGFSYLVLNLTEKGSEVRLGGTFKVSGITNQGSLIVPVKNGVELWSKFLPEPHSRVRVNFPAPLEQARSVHNDYFHPAENPLYTERIDDVLHYIEEEVRAMYVRGIIWCSNNKRYLSVSLREKF